MDEKEIVASLRQNIPESYTPPEPKAPGVMVDEQSSAIPTSINELGLLKLGNNLGVVSPDEATNGRLRYIYEQVAAVSADSSYEAILDKVNDYLIRLGLKFREDRFMRLYLWLKLNQERIAIDKEMAAQYGR